MSKNKIKTIEELAEIIKEAKKSGRKVALSHGCFDLMHIGHIKHFNAAKKTADILVVTVTPDRFINKGPGRPVFNELLRLEALANLEVVDYVGLNDAPDAVSLIERIKPDFYVKGEEYKNFKDHPTGMRAKEKEAVEKAGGELVFTCEPTFSSTSLINENFDFLPPNINAFLQKIRKEYAESEIDEFMEKINSLKVLVIGDPIIDEYAYCRVVGTVTKSPTLSAVYKNTIKMAGAAMAVARHVAEFAKSVEYIGVIGDKDNEKLFIEEELGKAGIKTHLVTASDRFTTLKRRFVSSNYPAPLDSKTAPPDEKMQKLFEIAFMGGSLIDENAEKEICSIFEKVVNENDLVILADFGHGMITPKIANLIASRSKWWSVNAQTNSTNFGFNLITKYKKPNFVCIDELEARLPFADRYKSREEILDNLSKAIECDEIMMSMGREGLMLKSAGFYYAPALTIKTVDTVGAGDAVLAMGSLCNYLKLPPLATVFLSSVMGALHTQNICNFEPVRKRKFLKFIKGAL